MNLFERVKNILMAPKKEWQVIKGEKYSVMDLFVKYAIILAAIPAVCGFIGYAVFGFSFGYGSFTLPFAINIKWAVFTYILSLVGVFVIGFIIDLLAPSFGSTKNLAESMKVVVFAYTASWIGGIFSIIPALSFIGLLAGIYSLYLMYVGLEIVKSVPKDKMVGYFITTIIVTIAVYFITGVIISSLVFGGYALTGAL
ncbi:MAG: hypothetical protein A2V66_09690 [Ignavibacteria bacterium RBG_13_36_8]|nr:MAG: hypothetical protein A2V66_09690 [Ignavibacteria bacterium RBG_13_36_8]